MINLLRFRPCQPSPFTGILSEVTSVRGPRSRGRTVIGSRSWLAILLPFLTATLFGQHPAIFLYDSEFNVINPVTGQNASKPFSVKNTCGTCHDYDTITKGFHFQAGWNKASDDFGKKYGRPWDLSDGFMGRWYPYAFRQLAKKHNRTPDEIDLTVYEFVGFSRAGPEEPPCGACHPGGGGLEYDRDGQRYDERLRREPSLRETLDGDYYRSQWDKSGVVEADCLLCHLPGYDFEERIRQLEAGNYQWAVVAASRLAIVEGAVKDGQTPVVKYNLRYFNADGSLTLPIAWPPPSENCLYCHSRSDIKKRGFSWNDIHNPDIHSQQGLACAACHPSELDHNFARGDENVSTVSPETKNTIRKCADCHSTGFLGATVPRHRTVRPFHLQRLSCEACHIPALHRVAALGVETSTGQLQFTPNPPEAKAFGEVALWRPVYERREQKRIYPLNSVLVAWWGNLDKDGILYPLFLREHEAAWRLYADKVKDDDGDGKPEVNSAEEILAGLRAFAQSLAGNRRFQRIHPVFVRGGKAWHLDEQGRLATLDYDLTGLWRVEFSINHNVAPARMALGATGCLDCHKAEADFFMGRRFLDLAGLDGKPVTVAKGAALGCSPLAFYFNSIHQQILSPLVSWSIVVVVFFIVLHYHRYGPKRVPFRPDSGEILRFTVVERMVHLFRLIAFVVLAVTGLIMAFNQTYWQELFFDNPKEMSDTHIVFGIVFIVTTIYGGLLWFEDALFDSYDKAWVRILGGYFGHHGPVPAGRFNAGQKMFYWYTLIFGLIMGATGVLLMFKSSLPLSLVCVVGTVHNLVGFLMLAGVLAHAYLGTIANPGTWRVLVDGYVSREWAKHHHPIWYEQVVKKQGQGSEGEAQS